MTNLYPAPPVIALLTDFGLRDGYVGTMKGVMLSLVPHAALLDITHEVAPQQVSSAAWLLSTCYRYFPQGTIFTCVVDPGVGSERRPLAVAAGSWLFVGPDNGLFSYVLEQETVHEAVALTNPQYHLAQVSATFQGRDIFAPVAAHLATGVPLSALGTTLAPSTLQRVNTTLAQREQDEVKGQVLHIDHFGNLVTSIPLQMVPEVFTQPELQLQFPDQQVTVTEVRRYFAQGVQNQPFLYGDSSGQLGVAVLQGNAARSLQVPVGDPVTLKFIRKNVGG